MKVSADYHTRGWNEIICSLNSVCPSCCCVWWRCDSPVVDRSDLMTFVCVCVCVCVCVRVQVNGTEADYEYEEITLERVRRRAVLLVPLWVAAVSLGVQPLTLLQVLTLLVSSEPHRVLFLFLRVSKSVRIRTDENVMTQQCVRVFLWIFFCHLLVYLLFFCRPNSAALLQVQIILSAAWIKSVSASWVQQRPPSVCPSVLLCVGPRASDSLVYYL